MSGRAAALAAALAASTLAPGAARADGAVRFLDGAGAPLPAEGAVLGVSAAVTNDATLPRAVDSDGASPDPENFRVEVVAPGDGGPTELTVESVDAATGRVRDRRSRVPLAPGPDGTLRTPWLRLVGDLVDARAPGTGDRVLRVALRDEVRATWRSPTGAAHVATARVGAPPDTDGPRAARRGTLRVRILRIEPGGAPVVGRDDAAALALGRDQVAIANEIWLQCYVGFGDPAGADVAIVDPPPPSLLAFGDDDGLPAAGGGEVRLRVDGKPVGPIPTHAGARPVDTALAVAAALRDAGYDPAVSENARTDRGAGRSADVLVRRRGGALATLSRDGDAPLGTDPRQRVDLGVVDLSDGLTEFGNVNASSGTLEERALLKAIIDDDPTTVELVVVNRFASGTRQGEAFIEGDGSAIVNVVLLDRSGMAQQREAWTQSHELGHVLLDHPLHPDNVGPDRPWMLMDADSSLGTVAGPKRLTPAECARARARSGAAATPALLVPYPE